MSASSPPSSPLSSLSSFFPRPIMTGSLPLLSLVARQVSPDQSQHSLSANIAAHEGPIWQVAWAHPKFGSILASCSYDRKVCVWKEVQPQQWTQIYTYAEHQSSVNAISFAPHELGLKLACASADGSISILTWKGANRHSPSQLGLGRRWAKDQGEGEDGAAGGSQRGQRAGRRAAGGEERAAECGKE